jgi:hypothetical protein
MTQEVVNTLFGFPEARRLNELRDYLSETESECARAILGYVIAHEGCSEEDIVRALRPTYDREHVTGEMGHLVFLGALGEQGHDPPYDFLGEPPYAYRVLPGELHND